MSRIGRKPVEVPAGVEIQLAAGNEITVKGPKGTLNRILHKAMIIKFENNIINVERPSEEKEHKSLHGLTRTLVANMVEGVTTGFKKELEINGIGYRAMKQGTNLVMNLGYSHQVIMSEVPGVAVDVTAPNKIVVSGCDKQLVGQVAADIRSKREPEPYQGKGIKYSTEVVRRKEGKAGKGAKGKK